MLFNTNRIYFKITQEYFNPLNYFLLLINLQLIIFLIINLRIIILSKYISIIIHLRLNYYIIYFYTLVIL